MSSYSTVALFFLCTASPLASQSDVPWDNAKIAALLMQFKNHSPKDSFDKPPSQASLLGKRFIVSWPLKSGDVTRMGISTSGYWSYNSTTEVLSIAIGSNSLSYEPARFVFQSSTSEGKVYAAQNGFGAAANVKKFESWGFGIEVNARQAAPLRHEINISGDAARQLANSLRVEIYGEFATDAGGGTVNCVKDRLEPTIQRPIEVLMTNCRALAKISRMTVVRGDTGQVIKQWP